MGTKRNRDFDWRFCLLLSDIFMVALAFILGTRFVQEAGGSSAVDLHLHAFRLLVAGFILLRAFRWQNLYSWIAFTQPSYLIPRLLFASLIAFLLVLLLRFVFGDFPGLFLEWKIAAFSLAFLFVLAGRLFLFWLLTSATQILTAQRLAFIGSGPRLHRLLTGSKKNLGKHLHIVGSIEAKNPTEKSGSETYPRLGPLDQLEEILEREKIDVLVMNGADVWVEDQKIVSEVCGRTLTRLAVVPASLDVLTSFLRVQIFAGVPVVVHNVFPINRLFPRILRRGLDITGALVGLALSAPLLALLALLIKRESPGPVIFKQTRIGWGGKPFTLYKLRSMRLDAETRSGAVWAVQDDPRRLAIGAFMREKNLDELPQFWNVLKGEMSLVGPRPERPEFVEEFKDDIRYYHLRHSCKPGLTGWAAVNGLRGSTSLEDRLLYDLYYIEHWSLWFDIKILFMTLAPPKNAY